MANEEKIRILDEQPVENAGSLLYIRTLAGSSDASKPTSLLANGSVFIETDTGKVFIFDEVAGWTEMQAGGGSSLPPVTASDNGKVLGVVDGAWAASEQGKKFIVTLTPTALDYSGTMDKTVAEINAAYKAGQEIVFSLSAGGSTYEIPLAYRSVVSGDHLYFACYIINTGANMIINAFTSDVQESSTYGTSVYSLTPAS